MRKYDLFFEVNAVYVEVFKNILQLSKLTSFEGSIKQEQPWTVMCSYNQLTGYYCSETKYFLNDILKEDWAT